MSIRFLFCLNANNIRHEEHQQVDDQMRRVPTSGEGGGPKQETGASVAQARRCTTLVQDGRGGHGRVHGR